MKNISKDCCEWPVHAIPVIILVDNAEVEVFKSTEFTGMVYETVGSEIRRTVKTPNYAGAIERVFGTIYSEFRGRLAGYAGNSLNGNMIHTEKDSE